MLATKPSYDEKGELIAESIELKVVDFGIFGSVAGIRMENITYGSLKFMAPEVLKGHTQSSPKIDVWSLGLMLNGMVLGFLPFTGADRKELEHQIINEELNYRQIKRLKPATIKDEFRKTLNYVLRRTSDDVIDLIEKMLCKDPAKRIDDLGIFEHPWIKQHKKSTDVRWSDDDEEEHNTDGGKERSSSVSLSDKNMQETKETNFDSDQVKEENRSSRGTSSPNSFFNSDFDKGRAKKDE